MLKLPLQTTASSTIKAFEACFISLYLFARTMVTSTPNGVDSFAWTGSFRCCEGVLLKTAKNGRLGLGVGKQPCFGQRALATKYCQILTNTILREFSLKTDIVTMEKQCRKIIDDN